MLYVHDTFVGPAALVRTTLTGNCPPSGQELAVDAKSILKESPLAVTVFGGIASKPTKSDIVTNPPPFGSTALGDS